MVAFQGQPGCECCAPASCTGCCSPALSGSDTLTLSLGSASLADVACGGFCSGIAGDYVLAPHGDCLWLYLGDCVECNGTFPPDVCTTTSFQAVNLRITLSLNFDSGTGKCSWQAAIVIGDYWSAFGYLSTNCATGPQLSVGPGAGNDLGCSYFEGAIYATPGSDPTIDNCRDTGPWTLSKASEDTYYACSGSLPGTVTLTLS
jgi:hypothetical protein